MYTLSKLSDKYKQNPTTNDLMICGSCKDKNIMVTRFDQIMALKFFTCFFKIYFTFFIQISVYLDKVLSQC
jgi:hypothetical protein